ncbi:MAG TPA: ATP-binding protein [Anaerolineales bacterium]|nr:ATP-binding protein [Anaerolineales bacterium]
MTLDKFFDNLNAADLKQLIENKVSGCRTVEYTECLPDDTFDSQKEFLAEVASFANTAGGNLVYGIKEENGIPVALPGIPGKDPDSEIIRLEKLLRDHIQPKCQGVVIRAVDMTPAAPVIIIRIPESWTKPHVVNFQGHWRFYARNSAGKYPLGVTELKSAFLTTTGLGEQIRSFHLDRLNKISFDEAPVSLMGKARTIFHLVPYSAFESGSALRFAAMEDIWSIPLMYASTSSYRSNLDGLVVYHEQGDGGLSAGYTQVFRNGIIESVNANLFGSSVEGPYLPSVTFETDTIAFLDACLAFYRKLCIRMPAVLFVSLAGAQDCQLAVHRRPDTRHKNVNRIDRDPLLLPEVILESLAVHLATVLKPVFNAIWNSIGWERLYGYAETGEKGLIFPTEKFAGEQVDVSQRAKTKGH